MKNPMTPSGIEPTTFRSSEVQRLTFCDSPD